MKDVLLIALLAAPAAWPQSLSFGVKGGVPLANAVKVADVSSYTSKKSPAVFGPVCELHLLGGVSAEAGLFYRRLRYESSAITTTGQAWELPLLVKYRAPGAVLRPIIEAGLSFRRLARFNPSDPPELEDRSATGPTIGGGLELSMPLIRVSAELRYTRWGSHGFRAALTGLATQLNQADLLLGIQF